MDGAERIIKLDSAEIEIQHKDETREQRMKTYYDSLNLKNCVVTDPKGEVGLSLYSKKLEKMCR